MQPIRASANWRKMSVHDRDWDLRKWNKMDQLKRGKHIKRIEEEARSEDRNQAFLSAIRDGDIAAATEYLRLGVSANCVGPPTDAVGCQGTKFTGLHHATLSGHLQAIRLLLDHGADVEARDREGCTPLLLATIYGHVFIASMLLDHGAQVDAKGMHGQTALHKAALHGQSAIASLLIDRGAFIHSLTTFGETPLALALFSKSYNVASILRRANGEDVADHRDHDASWRPRTKGDLAMSKFKQSNYMMTDKKKKKNRNRKRSKSPHRFS